MSDDETRNITVVGAGYVGLVNAACLSEIGHRVTCLDRDPDRVARLTDGDLGLHEPGLDELVARNAAAGRLSFSGSYDDAIGAAEIIFVCVDTPADPETGPDLHNLTDAVDGIAATASRDAILVLRSTVPPGTAAAIERRLAASDGARGLIVVSHPEFFQEGRAVKDCRSPLRIVVGSRDRAAAASVAALWRNAEPPVVSTDAATAEMIKQASNAFLAAKISFINDIAGISSLVGADIDTVAEGMGLDPRIGNSYLRAGIGFGGSCLPKDLRTLISTAKTLGWTPLTLEAALAMNDRQRSFVVEALRERLGSLASSTVAVLGLTFKPDTLDLRDSPAVAVADALLREGARVQASDPLVGEGYARALPPGLVMARDAYEAVAGADAVVLATEWRDYSALDWIRVAALMKGSMVIDGRNALSRREIAAAGLEYVGIGRGSGAAGRRLALESDLLR